MNDRNWDAEMAKIDRQLASISDDQLVAKRGAPVSSVASVSSAPSDAPHRPASLRAQNWSVAIRVTLAVALGAAAVFWPYPSACGLGLGGYLGVTASVAAAGTWAATWAWRARAPRAHILSVLVIVWGASLAAREVLPRVGYAKEVRAWACR
jgi:hypothetical protein